MCTLWPIMSNRIDVWLMSNPPMSTFDELEHPTDNCYIIWESDANWASWYRFVVYPPRMSMSGLSASIQQRHKMKIRGEFRCRHPRQLDLDTTSALPIVNRWKLGILIYRIRCLSSSNVDVGFILESDAHWASYIDSLTIPLGCRCRVCLHRYSIGIRWRFEANSDFDIRGFRHESTSIRMKIAIWVPTMNLHRIFSIQYRYRNANIWSIS